MIMPVIVVVIAKIIFILLWESRTPRSGPLAARLYRTTLMQSYGLLLRAFFRLAVDNEELHLALQSVCFHVQMCSIVKYAFKISLPARVSTMALVDSVALSLVGCS